MHEVQKLWKKSASLNKMFLDLFMETAHSNICGNVKDNIVYKTQSTG